MSTTLRDKSLQEFDHLISIQIADIEQRFSSETNNNPSLAQDIWQMLDNATNLCMLLWSLKLDNEAGKLEDLKLHLTKMHREIVSEISKIN